MAIIVDAKDESAVAFYARFGYQPLDTGMEGVWLRRMILALADVRKANEDVARE